MLYAQEEQFELAAQTLERFLEQKPDTPLIRWYLALVYERLNRIDDAIVQLRFVLNQSPKDEQAQERLRILQRAKAAALIPAPPLTPTSTVTTTRAHSVKKKRR